MLMCIFNPTVPKITPPPVKNDEGDQVNRGIEAERRRRAAAYGREDTVATGSQGLLGAAPVAKKKLLGE
jgi:hypothetical protein